MNQAPHAPVIAALREIGFKKRASLVFTKKLDDDSLGWVGLNEATRYYPPGESAVHPIIGVRNQAVERLIAELRNDRFHEYHPPSASIPLFYLMPEKKYKEWILNESTSEALAVEIAGSVVQHGFPFMEEGSSLAGLSELLDRRQGPDYVSIYRRLVVRYLCGDSDGVVDLLGEVERDLLERVDPAADILRNFLVSYRARVSHMLTGE